MNGDCPSAIIGFWTTSNIQSTNGVLTACANISAIIPKITNVNPPGTTAANAFDTAGGTCSGILITHPFLVKVTNNWAATKPTNIAENIAFDPNWPTGINPHAPSVKVPSSAFENTPIAVCGNIVNQDAKAIKAAPIPSISFDLANE